ncbi:MAG: hypothetical protein RIQ88_670 [Actinomycetota bacterium]|jgi:hypothetical protein
MKKKKYYYKVYGIPVVPKPLREVYLETFETKVEADNFINSVSKLQEDGKPLYKAFKIKTGAYRNL